MLELQLQKCGYEVRAAASTREALDMLVSDRFDLVLADIIMPEMDGFQLLAEVRKSPDMASVPFVFLSADRSLKSKIKGLEMGVDEYMTKPCSFDELRARVDSILRRAEAASARAAPVGSPREGWDFSGKLAAMPLQELLQVLEMNKKLGVLRIETSFGTGEVYLENGAVAHAAFAGIEGEEAIYLMFAMNDGTFDFRAGVRPTLRTIRANVAGLLIEGMRRMDETHEILSRRQGTAKKQGGGKA